MIEKEFEPAFPILDDAGSGLQLRHCGMNLRDYFAAKALQGLSANPEANGTWSAACTAQWSYELADAMMKEREQ